MIKIGGKYHYFLCIFNCIVKNDPQAHPNIVKLYEVIDDQDEAKIYLVMDLLKKGSINSKAYWKVEKGKAYKEDEKYKISEEKLKKYFRDFLLGLDYCRIYCFFNCFFILFF